MHNTAFILLLFLQHVAAIGQGTHAFIDSLEIPYYNEGGNPVYHTAYAVSYNTAQRQPYWVAYQLNSNKIHAVAGREDRFRADPVYKTQTANDADYAHSGYDKGHLAPAADMAWSEQTMRESFYYSNISPQLPAFNRGIWKQLEEQVRHWAREYDSVYIVTGPIVFADTFSIGENKVTVPTHFFKVVLQYSAAQVKGIAFVIPNAATHKTISNFAVNIDSVETITGINFFPLLPDTLENETEKKSDINKWSWGNENVRTDIAPGKNTTRDTRTQEKNNSTTVQCSGTTKSGKQCKRMTTSASGRCYQHE